MDRERSTRCITATGRRERESRMVKHPEELMEVTKSLVRKNFDGNH